MSQVSVTEAAAAVIDRLRERHGPLMFHQSGGCCDGSAPMCYPDGELILGDNDVLLGAVHGCPFYMAAFQYDLWKHTQLLVDVTPGRGASFSLEIPLGLRFVIKSKLRDDAEWETTADNCAL
jgi:hypothetical protein